MVEEADVMEFKKLTDTVSVSPQITPEDVKKIKDAGFRSIVCNRPDGEGNDQPTFEEIEMAAREIGLECLYQPVISGMVQDEQAEEFGRTLTHLPGPVFAYCRTGTRCTIAQLLQFLRNGSNREINQQTG